MERKYRLKRNGKSIREFNSRQEINDYVSGNYPNSIWDQGNLNELVVAGRKPPEKPKQKPKESTLDYVSRKLNDLKKEAISTVTADWGHRVSNANKNPRAMDAVESGGNIAGGLIAGAAALPVVVEAAPAIYGGTKIALNTAGQALTPSTWIGGAFRAAGTQAPNWLLNGADLTASAYFAGKAGEEIGKNGLNWNTGLNAVLSLAPFTRDEKAIEGVANAFRKPMSSVSSVVDDFRAARNTFSSPKAILSKELNKSIKNTQFINVPIEHVSPNGITKGSALNVGKEGIHFSPTGSSTTPKVEDFLLNQKQFPFVRTGNWTYSNNTKPVIVQDTGYFGKGFNPDFDAKVNNGIINFSYTNNFEGKGNTSYLTMEPSWGLQLSKNTTNNASRIDWDAPDIVVPEGVKLADGTLIPKSDEYLDDLEKYFNPDNIIYKDITKDGVKIGRKERYLQNGREYSISRYPDKISVVTPDGVADFPFPKDGDILSILKGKREALQQARQFILNSRDNWIQSLDEIPKDIVKRSLIAPNSKEDISGNRNLTSLIDNSKVADYIKASVKSDIDNVYLSDTYVDRFMKSLKLDPNDKEYRKNITMRLQNDLEKTLKTNKPIFYQHDAHEGGISSYASRIYGINGNAGCKYFDTDWSSVISHEFGHNLYNQDTPTGQYIKSYTQKLLKENSPEYKLNSEIARAINPDVADFINYLSKPNEFRQRVMEGVRYGIKEGNLTPEEIYNECKVPGFLALKKYFTKPYLIKMLGLMLGTTPLIVNTNNDKSS